MELNIYNTVDEVINALAQAICHASELAIKKRGQFNLVLSGEVLRANYMNSWRQSNTITKLPGTRLTSSLEMNGSFLKMIHKEIH